MLMSIESWGGLYAIAGAIAWSAWLLHRDVVRVYYPQVKWMREQHEWDRMQMQAIADEQGTEDDDDPTAA